MRVTDRHPKRWREYQRKLKAKNLRRRLLQRLPLLALCGAGALVALLLAFFSVTWLGDYLRPTSEESPSEKKAEAPEPGKQKAVPAVKALLKDLEPDFKHAWGPVAFEKDGQNFTLHSSLDFALQDYTLRLLQRSRTLQAAVVVLRPSDGRVLAFVYYDQNGKAENLCLRADFPAASIFKIVTAAAAMETAGFTPDSKVHFAGRKYTLYKRQLRKKKGKYSATLSFRRAFATSINPIFGKLGIYELGREVLSEYAAKFFFDQPIPFDFPLEKSFIKVPSDDFGLAEIASGFNKKTLISPLHAALLAGAVANDGVMMAPWMVERIENDTGETLYSNSPQVLGTPVSKETAGDLRELMRETVLYGTCRDSFRSLRRKKRFRNVDLGAKTGTINDRKDRYKFDWFTAFALPEDEREGICVAVLGVHGEKLGLRAHELGRYIIKHQLT